MGISGHFPPAELFGILDSWHVKTIKGIAMINLSEKVLRDEMEMRAFYESVGVSAKTTDLAIKALKNKPVANHKQKNMPVKDKNRKAIV